MYNPIEKKIRNMWVTCIIRMILIRITDNIQVIVQNWFLALPLDC